MVAFEVRFYPHAWNYPFQLQLKSDMDQDRWYRIPRAFVHFSSVHPSTLISQCSNCSMRQLSEKPFSGLPITQQLVAFFFLFFGASCPFPLLFCLFNGPNMGPNISLLGKASTMSWTESLFSNI
jgi:hypothetical protein